MRTLHRAAVTESRCNQSVVQAQVEFWMSYSEASKYTIHRVRSGDITCPCGSSNFRSSDNTQHVEVFQPQSIEGFVAMQELRVSFDVIRCRKQASISQLEIIERENWAATIGLGQRKFPRKSIRIRECSSVYCDCDAFES